MYRWAHASKRDRELSNSIYHRLVPSCEREFGDFCAISWYILVSQSEHFIEKSHVTSRLAGHSGVGSGYDGMTEETHKQLKHLYECGWTRTIRLETCYRVCNGAEKNKSGHSHVTWPVMQHNHEEQSNVTRPFPVSGGVRTNALRKIMWQACDWTGCNSTHVGL